MHHPVLRNIRSVAVYFGMWILIMGIHFFVFYFLYGVPFIIALADSFVWNGLFAFFGIPVWYVVRYSVPTWKTRFNFLFNHLTSLALLLVIWTFSSYGILYTLFSDITYYKSFLLAVIPYRIVVGALFYLLLILAYYLMIYYNNLQDKLKEEARLNSLLKESELNMLRSQINPHFLFNSLNSISSLTITNPEKAREMLIELSDFLRYSVATNESSFTTLDKEMANIERYLKIEKIRFGEKLVFEFRTGENCSQHNVPAMLLQPLFENAIKHGVYESTDQVKIEMDCVHSKDCLEITLVNDFDPGAKARKGAGVGLKNIRERLKLLYKSDTLIKTAVNGTKFSVFLCLPDLTPVENKT